MVRVGVMAGFGTFLPFGVCVWHLSLKFRSEGLRQSRKSERIREEGWRERGPRECRAARQTAGAEDS